MRLPMTAPSAPAFVTVSKWDRAATPNPTAIGTVAYFLTRAIMPGNALFIATASADPAFLDEFRSFYSYMNRPSWLYFAENLTKIAGGAKIWLKREDL